MSDYIFLQGDRSTAGAPLKVGDVCHEPERLRVGVLISEPLGGGHSWKATLIERADVGGLPSWRAQAQDDGWRGHVFDEDMKETGVTILALPEEQPVSEPYKLPAAPSLDELVPVNSRWKDAYGDEFAFLGGCTVEYARNGRRKNRAPEEILRDATRIDEPARSNLQEWAEGLKAAYAEALGDTAPWPVFGGPAQKAFYDSHKPAKGPNVCRGHSSCLLPGGHEGLHETNDAPAPPPARCAPGCTPKAPCMEMRWPWKCPGYVESEANRWNADQTAPTTMQVTVTLPEPKTADQLEAMEWRSQRYEPATNGLGGMVGRYRYSR